MRTGSSRGAAARAASCGVVAYQKYCVVVAVGDASFGSKVNNICGVWSLVGGDVIAEGRRERMGAAKLEISADRIT